MVLKAQTAKKILEQKVAEKKHQEALKSRQKSDELKHQKELAKKLSLLLRNCLELALDGVFSLEYTFADDVDLRSMVESRGFNVTVEHIEVDLVDEKVRAYRPDDRSRLLRRLETALQKIRHLSLENPSELSDFTEIVDQFCGAPESIAHICNLVKVMYDLNAEYASDSALSLQLDAKLWSILKPIQADIGMFDHENEIREIERGQISWQKISREHVNEDAGDLLYARKLRCVALPDFQSFLRQFSRLAESTAEEMKSRFTLHLSESEGRISILYPDGEEFEFQLSTSDLKSIFETLGYSIRISGQGPQSSMQVSF